MGFEMVSQVGERVSEEGGISRGIWPAWKNWWSEISSMLGRVVGLGESREEMRFFASSDIGLAEGKSY